MEKFSSRQNMIGSARDKKYMCIQRYKLVNKLPAGGFMYFVFGCTALKQTNEPLHKSTAYQCVKFLMCVMKFCY